MVEQRPFKALVVGSSPTQPNDNQALTDYALNAVIRITAIFTEIIFTNRRTALVSVAGCGDGELRIQVFFECRRVDRVPFTGSRLRRPRITHRG